MKKMQLLLMVVLGLLAINTVQAQEEEATPLSKLETRTETLENTVGTLSKFKISGYIQAQYQSGQKDASLKAGTRKKQHRREFSTGLGCVGLG